MFDLFQTIDVTEINDATIYIGAVILLTFSFIYMANNSILSNPHTFPPGPKRWPIVGSLFSVPTFQPWVTYKNWSEIYGDIIYFEALGQPTILLGSYEVAIDLLEKRSAIYSDRPQTPALELSYFTSWSLGLLKYGRWWRRHRRVFQQYYKHASTPKFYSIQLKETHRFLQNLMLTPDSFLNHIHDTLTTTILSATYGEDILQKQRVKLFSLAKTTSDVGTKVLLPGTFWVDYLPFLRFFIDWMPRMVFQHELKSMREELKEFVEFPFSLVKEAKNNGTMSRSVVANMLDKASNSDNVAEEENIAKNVAAVAFIGGADTTASTIQTFFFAMALSPGVQQKAQDELDSVIGPGRLPDFNDRDSLIYINALVKECLRWQPVLPLGVVHKSIADDLYGDYFIPKGTMVLANAWAMLHDPEVYPEPDAFKPERFIQDGQLDPHVRDPAAAFGFGRRICPGRHFADSSLFILISSVLHVFRIEPPFGEERMLQADLQMSSGAVSFPDPFKCAIKVRSPAAQALINSMVDSRD